MTVTPNNTKYRWKLPQASLTEVVLENAIIYYYLGRKATLTFALLDNYLPPTAILLET